MAALFSVTSWITSLIIHYSFAKFLGVMIVMIILSAFFAILRVLRVISLRIYYTDVFLNNLLILGCESFGGEILIITMLVASHKNCRIPEDYLSILRF